MTADGAAPGGIEKVRGMLGTSDLSPHGNWKRPSVSRFPFKGCGSSTISGRVDILLGRRGGRIVCGRVAFC